jgi:UDP-3-O-[3-hydroxymyristoyl] glucosamine N-acyltransferase
MKTQEIADFLSAELVGDPNIEITGLAALDTAVAGEIAFSEGLKEFETGASAVLVSSDFDLPVSCTVIKAINPKLAFTLVANSLKPRQVEKSWHDTADIAAGTDIRASFIGPFVSIGPDSSVGESSEIHAGVRIGRNVRIGARTRIYPNCVIYDGALVGNDCVIHAGTVIGSDGFGYVKDGNGEYRQFPQIGNVVVEANVEIGANSCIDRGSLGTTLVGEGTKIDNMVHLAHNVQIGKRVVIAAQTGISGSTVIEDDCVIGGQVGMGDHARVQSGAVIGSQAGVLPGKIVRPGVWWGTPVQPLAEFKRQNAHLKGLQRMKDDVKELKKLLDK